MKRTTIRILGALVLAVVLAAILGPWAVKAWWGHRSSNPVRRGVALAGELGCFSCHGPEGRAGIADPGHPQGVPAWSGGVWMMYVASDEEIRRIILDGATPDPVPGAADGPAARPPGTRFGFLKAPRSTVLQPGPVHGGVTDDPARQLDHLLHEMVG